MLLSLTEQIALHEYHCSLEFENTYMLPQIRIIVLKNIFRKNVVNLVFLNEAKKWRETKGILGKSPVPHIPRYIKADTRQNIDRKMNVAITLK